MRQFLFVMAAVLWFGLAGCATTRAETVSAPAASVVATLPPITSAVDAAYQYPFKCNVASLTADFSTRGQQPQTLAPQSEWYTRENDEYVNGGWGPRPVSFDRVQVPGEAGCDAVTWQRERILAVAFRYLNNAGNPNALDYRHHHIPAWDPPTNSHVSGDNDDPETNDLGAWDPGTGLDCSNFAAWVFNFGLGIRITSAVRSLGDNAIGAPAKRLSKDGPFEPGDLIFLHPNGDEHTVSHVVIYVDANHIIDDRYDYKAADGTPLRGVHIRPRTGWYKTAALGGWRLIGQ